MNSKCINSIIVFSLCSTLLDFMIIPQNSIIFPRDRTVHIIISAFVAYFFTLIIEKIDFTKGIQRIALMSVIGVKTVFTINNFINYFSVFYGSDTFGIIFLTIVTSLFGYSLKEKSIEQLYAFFVLTNILMLTVILIFSADKLNVGNIYSNDISILFSGYKLHIFFDIFTIAAVTPTGKIRKNAQKIYLFTAATMCVALTLLQGLAVKGNMMYSITPLQAISQIISGTTVRRFDYIITIFQSVNYFAAIIFYVWAIKIIFNRGEKVEFEEI